MALLQMRLKHLKFSLQQLKEAKGYKDKVSHIVKGVLSTRAEVQRCNIERQKYMFFDFKRAIKNIRPKNESLLTGIELYQNLN